MRTIQRRKNWLARLVVPAVLGSCLFYFSTHAKDGEYGLDAKAALHVELRERQDVHEDLRERRERLEQRVRLIEDGTLERDMIDERVRQSLNYLAADEIVILR